MRVKASNLPTGTTEEDLHTLFEPFGKVRGITLVESPIREQLLKHKQQFEFGANLPAPGSTIKKS